MSAGLLAAIVGGAGSLELAAMALAGWWAWSYANGKRRRARSEARMRRILGK